VKTLGTAPGVTEEKLAEERVVASEKELREYVDNLSTFTAKLAPDGSFLLVGRTAQVAMGLSQDELMKTNFLDGSWWAFDPVVQARVKEAFRRAASGERISYDEQLCVQGQVLTISFSLTPVFAEQGRVRYVLAEARDISAEMKLEAKFQGLLEAAPDALVVVDQGGLIRLVNRQAEVLFGYSREGLVGQPIEVLVPERFRGDHPAHRQGYFVDPRTRPMGATVELSGRRRDGTEFPVDISLASFETEDGTIVTAGVRDVTDRKRAEALESERMTRELNAELERQVQQRNVQLREAKEAEAKLTYQALHDPLTGLPTRLLFMDRLSQALARSDRRPGSVGVIFLDLDRFKVTNDSLGHDVGDLVLRRMADRLRMAVRPADTASRFGGDEFVVLCEDIPSEEEAIVIAERLAQTVAQPIALDEGNAVITTSIGIALARAPDDRPEELVRDADAALYRAKQGGGARHEMFDGRMRVRALRRLATEKELRRAIEEEELRLYYQPLVHVDTGRVSALEALVRWDHPQRGLLTPDHFIPVAEDSGLIVPLGDWVLEEACRQWARWHASAPDRQPLTMAVNLSTRQLGRPDFERAVHRVLSETGVEPAHLSLEITESVFLEAAPPVLATLRGLRELGVRLAIDDFGTGYSSLTYLKRIRVDALKVDRSFVQGLGQDSEDSAIVAAMVSLAHALGLSAIAEGVETAEQLEHLRRLECDLAQGYYFGEPQLPESVWDLVETDSCPIAVRQGVPAPP
jgi:diguanylate cyclase (GGDEF)-like protein/PAS domain S-box-containing protein